ncbi:MAG: SBBP repeat-containing protein [Bacteroidia bacterium]
MKKILLFFMGVLACTSMYSQSQLKVFQDWQSNAGSQNFLFKNRTKTDASNNIYVVGATMNGSGNYDILVAKYNPQGTQQWISQYNGAGSFNDIGTGVTIDASGNVYITGTTCSSASPTSADLIVIKYNSSGVQQWVQTYNGTGSTYDAGADIFQMTGTNVGIYITGSSYNASGNTDFITLKYSTAGVQQWVSRYNHTSNLNDAAVRIGVNATGVTIIGAVETATTTYSCATITYNALTGAQTGVTISTGGTSTITEVNDMVIDASNNIYITGTGVVSGQGNNYFTIKLNNLLVQQWQSTYDGASNLDDISKGVQVDASGNVFVTGYSTITGQGRNMVTIKYNSSGTQQWAQTYNNPLNTDDEAYGIALDNSGNAYVTGYNESVLNQKDFYTIKYNTSGTSIWEIATDGSNHLHDVATNIVIDNAGAVIVAGQSETSTGVYEYLTVKYVEKNVITPTDFNSESPRSSFLYYENKGQLVDQSNTAVPSVRYYTNSPYPAFFFKENSMSMIFAHVDTVVSTNDSLHRVDLTFNQVNATAKTYPMEEQDNYLSYFLAHCPKGGITEVRGNQRLVTTNLYPSIDLVYYSNQNGMKYYFVVKPGANPASIDQVFTGATSTAVNAITKVLSINTSIGSLVFDRPTVYQLTTSNTIVPITTWYADYVSSGTNSYKFNIGTYDNTKALIIEVDQGNTAFSSPVSVNANMEWSTFVGGSMNDDVRDIVAGSGNNVFLTGAANSNPFLASVGPTIGSYTGLKDAYVAKFNNVAVSKWVAYIGGTGNETAMAIAIDKVENIFVVGKATSSGFFHLKPGMNDTTLSGTQDGFYINLKTDALGMLCNSFIGGASNTDIATSVALKEVGAVRDVYITGYTSSASGFPLLTTGAFYQSTIAGSDDSFIMKLNVSNNNQWCSLFGGTGTDIAMDIDMRSGSNNPVIVGHTTTSSYSATTCATPTGGGFPFCNNSGAYYSQTFGGGGSDDFIIEFNNSTQALVWSTFFGGTSGEYAFNFHTNDTYRSPNIAITPNGDVYVTGGVALAGTPTFPLLNSTNGGTYNQAWNASLSPYNAYIGRFNSSRQQTWTTFFGGDGANLPLGICSDPNSNVFMTGFTDLSAVQSSGSYCNVATSGNFPICNFSGLNYLETNVPTAGRVYISAFSSADNILWSTAFGDNINSHGHGISATASKLFVGGIDQVNNTLWDYDNTSTLDYFKTTNPANLDGAIARFDITSILMGINDYDQEQSGMDVFPNPSTNSISISFKKELKSDFEVSIVDIQGRVVIHGKYDKNEKIIKFDIADFSNGMYFVHVTSAETNISTKFIKSK